jgi:HEAT repeat protein
MAAATKMPPSGMPLPGGMLSRPCKAPDDRRRPPEAAHAWRPILAPLLLPGLAVLLPGCAGKSTGEWVAQLRSRDSADRLHAVKALAGRSGEAAAVVPALGEALRDEDAFVRRDAAEALTSFGAAARPAVPALLAATQDRNAGVRKAAAKALGRIDPEAAGQTAAR